MDGISRGTVLGGRYTLEQALSSRDGVEQWIAADGTLSREVTVTLFAVDHPHASAALDSARRVAGVEDRRLAQVLDVGTESDPAVSYVITEATHHARSIAALLREDTLPAEEVRRLVGESAVALETARQRGLHHQTLTPHEILRSPDGAVQVSGVAVSAALLGRDDDDGDRASRDDVRALVSVAYAGLTGRWPGSDEVPGLDPVGRRADGEVPAPSELVDKVPGDLDTLCRTVLSADEGPRSPGELARQLSPWSAERVHGAGGREPGTRSDISGRRRLATGTALTGAALAAPDSIGRTDSDSTDPGLLDRGDDPTMVGRRPQFDDDETSTYTAADERDADPYVEEDLDPPLPLLTHGTEEPDRDSSRLALSIVAVVVVIAMVLGFLGLRSMFSGGSDDSEQAGSPTGTSATDGTGSGSRSSTPAPTPVEVSEVSTFNPDGVGEEHGWEAKNVVDDDPSSVWETRYYRSLEFSEGRGPGLVLDLGKDTEVSRVKVVVNGAPIGATVSTADDPEDDGEELGVLSGTGEQTVTPTAAQKGRYVIVKVTKLGTQETGQNRARIAQVQVLS